MPQSRYPVTVLNAALDERWTTDRRAVFVRKLSSVVVRIAFGTIIFALLYSVMASAEESPPTEWQSVSSIRAAAENYVRTTAKASNEDPSTLVVIAGELDSRLQLAKCRMTLQAFALNGSPLGARNTIAIRCADDNGPTWTIYVPTTLEVEKPVYVLRRTLPRDAHISSDDVELQSHRLPGIGAGYFSDIAALREQHLKRSVVAGSILTADALSRDLLIKRGQEVSLVFGTDGFAVRASGIALADGGIADRIHVQNRSSLKIVEGTIESGNLVRVGM